MLCNELAFEARQSMFITIPMDPTHMAGELYVPFGKGLVTCTFVPSGSAGSYSPGIVHQSVEAACATGIVVVTVMENHSIQLGSCVCSAR